MERLTTRDIDGTPILLHDKGYAALLDRLAAYEDTELEPGEVNDLKALEVMQVLDKDRAREIAKAEAEGHLVVLPCKVGDVLWDTESLTESPSRHIVLAFDVLKSLNMVHLSGGQSLPVSEIGKTVFPTREEAEEALKQEVRDDPNEART